MHDRRRRSQSTNELRTMARTFNRDGVMVRTHCRRISGSLGDRYEIVLEGYAQAAIVDVPGEHDEAFLRGRLEEAVACFIESVKLRAGVFAN